jgi:hypothetical protein
MYFNENKSSPQGQVHFFPVIMDARILEEQMLKYIGKKP